jgi:hypothetical protein
MRGTSPAEGAQFRLALHSRNDLSGKSMSFDLRDFATTLPSKAISKPRFQPRHPVNLRSAINTIAAVKTVGRK